VEISEKLVTEEPANPVHRHQLAWALFNAARSDKSLGRGGAGLQRLNRAMELRLRVVAEQPASKDFHESAISGACALLARVLAICPQGTLPKGDLDEALASARKAAELLPGKSEAWQGLGAAAYRSGEWQESLKALETAIELNPKGDAMNGLFLAMAHWQLGQKEAAQKRYQEAVERIPTGQPEDKDITQLKTEAATLLGIPPVK
jgi:tetratricopeptide (TPR) repeat protein